MMGEEKSVLTKIGDAVEAVKDKAQEVGASLMVTKPTTVAKMPVVVSCAAVSSA